MPKHQTRFDVMTEIRTCEHIWSFDETLLNAELRRTGIDPDAMMHRLGASLGIAPEVMGKPQTGRDIAVRTPPATTSLTADPGAEPAPSPSTAIARMPPVITVELAGKVKFFDAAKGYGFFTADGEQGDVLVHISHLQAAGYRTVYEGARIHALVQRTSKGLQMMQILNLDESSATHPSQIEPRTREKVQPESPWVRALVKWYNTMHGYGFVLERQGCPDCFVHADVLRRWGMPPLRPGQVVEIRWGSGSKGRMVAEIRHPGDTSGLPPVH